MKHTRKGFDYTEPLVCNRPLILNGRETIYGDIFDKSAVSKIRAKQLYNMRKLEHMDTFIAQFPVELFKAKPKAKDKKKAKPKVKAKQRAKAKKRGQPKKV